MLKVLRFPRYCKCVDFQMLQSCQHSVCKCSSTSKSCNILGAFRMCREEKLFANATEPTRVAGLSMLRSFAVALKIVAGVTKF